MSLYNAKSTDHPDTFLFTKFDDDLNIVDESIYLTSEAECTCPAGTRPTCRHRQMLPSFLATDRIDTDWFFCHETGDWSQPFGDALDNSVEITQADIDATQSAPDSPPTEAEWRELTIANVKPKPTEAQPWINCPECNCGPGEYHKRDCSRGTRAFVAASPSATAPSSPTPHKLVRRL